MLVSSKKSCISADAKYYSKLVLKEKFGGGTALYSYSRFNIIRLLNRLKTLPRKAIWQAQQ